MNRTPRKQSGGPTYLHEDDMHQRGLGPVAGVDEAGRGPLAGPVVVAAVVLDRDQIPYGLNDSKKLTSASREALFTNLLETADVSIATASENTIDTLNIRAATLETMVRAVNGLSNPPAFVLVDGRDVPPPLVGRARALIGGDGASLSIAAASICAKVVRDRIMVAMDALYSGYGFAQHKGYGTAEHLEALTRLGPCALHRCSFAPVAKARKGKSGI